jgi:putative MATE family efflux protein
MRKDLTTGSITKTILVTAMPMVLALLLRTGFNIVDAIYVGRISAEAIAAVSLAFPIMFFIHAIGGGVDVGVTSLIARYMGAKKVEKADNVAEHGLLSGLVLGIVFMILGLIFGKNLLMLMGAGSLLDLSLDYLNIIFIGTLFMMLFFIGNGIFRGEGDMKTPMIIMVIATVINIILDPIFIFVLGLGVKGAAIATLISEVIGCILVIGALFMGKSSIKIRLRDFKFDFSIIKKIFKIGIPSSLSQVSMSISLFVMTRIVSSFGPYAIAAWGIIFRVDSVAVLPAIGLMIALISLVGQNVGAKKFDRAEKMVYRTSIIAGIFTGVIGLVFFAFPTAIMSIFNTNPEVIRYGVMYLRSVTLVYAFVGVGISINGGFLGAGDAITALFLTLLRVMIITIPVALILAFGFKLGILGVWLSFLVSTLISTSTALLLFRTGRWKKAHIKKEDVPIVG